MKRIPKKQKTQLKINESTQGDTIEYQMERILGQSGGIENVENRPVKYGGSEVIAITDIRSDKFDMAIDETNKVTKHVNDKAEKKRAERKAELDALNEKNKETPVGSQSADASNQK